MGRTLTQLQVSANTAPRHPRGDTGITRQRLQNLQLQRPGVAPPPLPARGWATPVTAFQSRFLSLQDAQAMPQRCRAVGSGAG